jgi:hypothetical protein
MSDPSGRPPGKTQFDVYKLSPELTMILTYCSGNVTGDEVETITARTRQTVTDSPNMRFINLFYWESHIEWLPETAFLGAVLTLGLRNFIRLYVVAPEDNTLLDQIERLQGVVIEGNEPAQKITIAGSIKEALIVIMRRFELASLPEIIVPQPY